MDGSSLANSPNSEEIEVSVFGPGYGESIIAHVGLGDWVVVDSCVDRDSGSPAAINYLRSIGVDPSTSVRLIVATHWDDDHMRGLASVFEECKSAKFACSASLLSDEFLTFVHGLGKRSMMTNSGVDEFFNVIQLLRQRVESSRPESRGPEFAIADRLLWRREGSLPAEVYALSPSSATIALAYAEIAQLLPTAGQPKRRAIALEPNRVAVALWVRVGDMAVLLGSDLEETGDPGTGWSAIVRSQTRPSGRACVFKVPHHGSATADDTDVWSEMLRENPFAVLTPFVHGNVGLPTRGDVRRICNYTPNAYTTARFPTRLTRKRHRAVEKTVSETVRSIRVLAGPTGQVRFRTNWREEDGDPSWHVQLFNGAIELNRIYG